MKFNLDMFPVSRETVILVLKKKQYSIFRKTSVNIGKYILFFLLLLEILNNYVYKHVYTIQASLPQESVTKLLHL